MLLEATPYSIELATPFVISRGARTHCHTVRVTVSHDHQKGIGECTPYPRYGESVESVIAQIESWTSDLISLSPQEAKQHLQSMPAGAARNAVDCALWDLQAKQAGKPVWDAWVAANKDQFDAQALLDLIFETAKK